MYEIKVETLGETIKKIRDEKSISQAGFGRKIGVSDKAVSGYERSTITPTLKTLEKIAEEFNVEFVIK